jgi:hypothetical protein
MTATKIKKNILDAQTTFTAQLVNARDYITNERMLGFFPERFSTEISQIPDENALVTMKQHPFVRWLHQQTHFQQAKRKTVDWSLSVIKTTPDEIISRYREEFALERKCALLIHFFTDNKRKLEHAVVTAKSKKPVITAMRNLRHEFNKGGGVYFENGMQQHLLQILLDSLLEKKGHHLYSAKRNHPSVLRQIITTQLIRALDMTYEQISDAKTIELCLDMTSIFFVQPMDKRDLEEIAKNILVTVREEKIFLNKTVNEILFEYAWDSV